MRVTGAAENKSVSPILQQKEASPQRQRKEKLLSPFLTGLVERTNATKLHKQTKTVLLESMTYLCHSNLEVTKLLQTVHLCTLHPFFFSPLAFS